MKKTLKLALSLLVAIALTLTVASCTAKEAPEGLWSTAVYTESTTIGEGEKTVTVEFSAADKVITFTVKTDAETVGDALLENGLISGDEGAYGLYVKAVNGITADYDIDQSYWAFYINGDYAMSGVDMTEIDESAIYRLEYTK